MQCAMGRKGVMERMELRLAPFFGPWHGGCGIAEVVFGQIVCKVEDKQ